MKARQEIIRGTMALLLALGVGISMLPQNAKAAKRFVAIGTGGPTGVYFIAGNAICKMVQKAADETRTALRCSAPSTGGSVYNINAIRAKDLEIGVAQSDVQLHAYQGTDKFEGQKFEKIRSLFRCMPNRFRSSLARIAVSIAGPIWLANASISAIQVLASAVHSRP